MSEKKSLASMLASMWNDWGNQSAKLRKQKEHLVLQIEIQELQNKLDELKKKNASPQT